MGGGMSEAVADDSLVGRIRGLVSEQLGVSISEVTSDANILDDLGADSLDVVEMVMAIEETFDIEISDEDTEAMRTIGDVETYVSKRLAGLLKPRFLPSRGATRSELRESARPLPCRPLAWGYRRSRRPGSTSRYVPPTVSRSEMTRAGRSFGPAARWAARFAISCCSGPGGTPARTSSSSGRMRSSAAAKKKPTR